MKPHQRFALRQQPALYRILRLALALFVLSTTLIRSATAAPVSSFTPPISIDVHMFELAYPGGGNTYVLCSSDDTAFDCTAFIGDSNHPYPYGNSNPVNVPVETDYLLDVVPSEAVVKAFHPTAIRAQAIAARSYVYWKINQGNSINNSNESQVFVPYAFESLPATSFPDNLVDPCVSSNLNNDQQIVCGAVAPRYYISYGDYPNDDLPAFTEYFADIPNRTLNGGQSYLIAIDDPISSHPAIVQDGHGHGMSQKGSSRWARGNLSYNINWDLGAWSVRWERAEQLLVHYYPGVRIRDANKQILIPADRWNPLQINWGTSGDQPPTMYHGNTYPITVKVQNTGVSDWTCGYPNFSYVLTYRWAKAGHDEVAGSSSASVCGVIKGDPSPTVNLVIQDIPNWGPGAYTIRFDIYVSSTSGTSWFGDNGWPPYNVGVCVDGPCKVFIPLALKNSGG